MADDTEKRARRRAYITFGLALILSGFFVWMGEMLLFFNRNNISSGTFVAGGVIALCMSFILMVALGGLQGLFVGAVTFFLALYSFGRSSDSVRLPILAWIMALVCFAVAFFLIIKMWPPRRLERMGIGDDSETT